MRYLLPIVLLTLAAPTFGDEPATVNVLSFNIRLDTASDKDNRWSRRTGIVHQQIVFVEPDFVGMQEVLPNQREDVAKMIGDKFASLSRTREATPDKGEACTLWYRADRWRLDAEDHGTFWLSETPEVAGSKSWDSSLPRICTWGRFVDKQTGKAIYVYNTHWDHRGEQARRQSAQLIAARIKARPHQDEPAILIGDFNAGEDSAPIATLRDAGFVDTFRAVHPDAKAVGTFGAWVGKTDGAKIDYIFTDGNVRPLASKIHREAIDGRWPSDHFALSVKLELADK
jgi:endonuclease/exonuclease/phosphatase family metal-dependent hydrolase